MNTSRLSMPGLTLSLILLLLAILLNLLACQNETRDVPGEQQKATIELHQ